MLVWKKSLQASTLKWCTYNELQHNQEHLKWNWDTEKNNQDQEKQDSDRE